MVHVERPTLHHGLGEGSGGTLSSLGDDEGSAEVNTMLIDRHRVANDDALSRSDVHSGGPHAEDTGCLAHAEKLGGYAG